MNELENLVNNMVRASVGYDYLPNVFETFSSRMSTYPPYDIVKESSDSYSISVALAGFDKDDIEIAQTDRALRINTVESMIDEPEDIFPHFLHRGIAKRKFKLAFALSEYVNVTSAAFDNGLLCIMLKSDVPEEKREKIVKIS